MNRLMYSLKRILGDYSMFLSVSMYSLKHKGAIGQQIFSIFSFLLKQINLSIFPVVNAEAYEKTRNCKIITKLRTNRSGVSGNTLFLGERAEELLSVSSISDLEMIKFDNVCIRGNSDVVVDNILGYVISEVSYNLEANEEVIDGLLYRTRNNVCLLRNSMCHPKKVVNSGIMISGKFCRNYYHVMYENLIRLLYLSEMNIPSDIPIVVDLNTMCIPAYKRVFEILTSNSNREILLVDEKNIYQFDTLYCISRVNQLPAHSRDINTPVPILYDQTALLTLRKQLLEFKSEKVFPKRLFITRTGTPKRHYNEEEVFEILLPYGFEKVTPESLSFEDQMSLFYNAEFIVSGSGAAFTNLLFISAGCTIICFDRGSHENPYNPPVFCTIAQIFGAHFFFFPRKKSPKKDIHVNYEIDCEEFQSALINMMK